MQFVLDLETKKGFDEVGGRAHFDQLGVSLIGLYRYDQENYNTFEENQIGELESLLSQSRRIIGFNIRRFDFPVLQPYCKNLKLADLPIFDILEELEKLLGHRVSLESVAKATLREGKSGSGLDAIAFYREGEIEKLKKYCLDDVRLTKEIYEFGKKFGKVYFLSKSGQDRIPVSVIWKDPEPPANLSLF